MNVAIVVAAGKGTRLGGNQPKQFLELDGIPIIIRTLRQFERCREIDDIVVVVHDGNDTALIERRARIRYTQAERLTDIRIGCFRTR